MKLDRLISFFLNDPSAKLLSSPHSAHIVYFLNQHFKVEGNIGAKQSELQERLNRFLDLVHETSPELMRERGEAYLTKWSTGDTRWLRRYYDSQSAESVYQLTPHTEDVLKFLTAVLDRSLGFVGTESRLTRIIDTLSDIIVRGSDDPQQRLEYLRAEKQRIEDEIGSIESGERVTTHSPTAIRERFADAVSDLVSLQGDFRAVEESFKSITREVHTQQNASGDSRGTILGFALTAEDELKEGDQGTSFEAFVKLLLSQSQQDELEKMTSQIDQIGELAGQMEGKRRIKGMIASLSAEAEKVLRTTRRLSATLRRLLDSRSSTTRLRLASVLGEIQAVAAKRADDPPVIGIDVFTELEIANVADRSFWNPPVEFEDVTLSDDVPDEDDRLMAFRSLAEMQRLDWDSMRRNVSSLLQSASRITLPQLLTAHPVTNGSIEVLGYIQLAHDLGHEVDQTKMEIIYVEDPDSAEPATAYEIPQVTFYGELAAEQDKEIIAHE